jgi:hypothetical protein
VIYTALLTQELRDTLPALYTTECESDPIVRARFFSVYSGWSWYAIEFDGEDTFWGYVDGFTQEKGYFSLAELSTNFVERDKGFTPAPLSQVMKR